MEYKKVKLKEVCTVNQGLQIPISKRFKEKGPNRYFYITIQFLKGNTDEYYIENPKKSVICQKEDILVVRTGNTGMVLTGVEGCFHNNFFKVEPNEKIYSKYLYYTLNNKYMYKEMLNAASGTTIPDLKHSAFYDLVIPLPTLSEQHKIVNVLESIDKKIELNNKINDNLSEQLKQIFNNKFYDKIQNNDCSEFKEYILYDVLDVIDNRGKTPKLVEVSNYPIIDVRAISGENRIIDYKQCQKYVDDEVYNTFFRSGHPKINDILISTVGSLAEMKIYMENKGTIAQNVVALRSKYDYPMYIYQYLKAIKNDLISYNIGSVQPSIKVTQFMKHNIYIPKDKELYEFENIAKLYTDKMFNISKENETLEQLRDTLLPKLMNGEIDLDKIEI